MNILLIGRATPRIRTDANTPTTRYIHQLATELVNMGHNVDTIISTNPVTHKYPQYYRTIFIGSEGLQHVLSPDLYELYFGIKVGWALRKLKHNYDVVHFLEAPSSAFFSLIFNPFRKIPFVFSSGRPIDKYGQWHDQSASRWVKTATNLLHSYVFRHADRVMTSSHALKKSIMNRLGINGNKITVAPFISVMPELFYPQPKDEKLLDRLNINKTDKVVLCLGEVSPYKNQLAIIRAIPDVLKEYPDTKFLFVGGINEQYYNILHAFINRYNIHNNVIFTGYVKRYADLPRYYNLADVFILLSEAEGNLPQTVLDAMCCGKPIITSNLPQNQEWSEDTIAYFEPRNTQYVAAGIRMLIDDRGASYKPMLSKKSLEIVLEHHSIDKIAEGILNVYTNQTKTRNKVS